MNRPDAATPGPDGFTNEPVQIGGLPRLHDHELEPLDPAYARVRTLTASAVGIVAAIGTVTATVLARSWTALVFGMAVVLAIGLVGVVHRIEVAHMGYLVRDRDVSFRSGVIARSVATVPFARVQHVSIDRGPLDRRFELATLQLRTAGGQVSIPGLDHEVAERLKLLVADRAAELAEAEIDGDVV